MRPTLHALIAMLAAGLPTAALAPYDLGQQTAQLTAPSGGKLPVPDTPGGGVTNPTDRLPGERSPAEINPPPAPVERIPEQIEPPVSRPGPGSEKQLPTPATPDRTVPDPGGARTPTR